MKLLEVKKEILKEVADKRKKTATKSNKKLSSTVKILPRKMMKSLISSSAQKSFEQFNG